MSGRNTSLISIDMSQHDENGNTVNEQQNFWPGMGRWHVGVKMTNATMAISTEGAE
jgi:hypothetical protein